MKIITNGEEITVAGTPVITEAGVRYPLASVPPAIGETVRLETDTGMHLRTDTVSDWLRAYLDGSVLVLTNEPAPEPAKPDLETLRAAKEDELSDACHDAITAGTDVQTNQGMEHFDLTETDQINLTTALGSVDAGATEYPYHSKRCLCRMFSADEIRAVSQAAVAHVLYHRTLCNHLLTWVRRTETAEELERITYTADGMPEDLAANMTQILAAAGEVSA